MTADHLVVHLRRTSRTLNDRASARDQRKALDRLIVTAVGAVPGADIAGLTLADDRYLPVLQDSEAVGPLDALQREMGEGPALDAMTDGPADGTLTADDLAGQDADRWPSFSPRAVEAGYRSVMSVLLEVEGTPRAALNLYAARPCGFDDRDRVVAGLLAVNVGTLLMATEQVRHLQHAIDTRDVIGRAKGVLMERFGLDQGEAFARLVEASQHSNMRLVDVAQWLSDECGTPEGGAPTTAVGAARQAAHLRSRPRG